ncbi:alpha/beta fold hydrolase [Thermostilla marina]
MRAVCKTTADRTRLVFGVLAAACLTLGCASGRYAELRSVPHDPLYSQVDFTWWRRPMPSDRTMQFLRRYDLVEDLDGEPEELLEKVRATIEADPTPEKVYAYAELSHWAAKQVEKSDPKRALDLYGGAVLYAYQYLFDDTLAKWRNPYDPQFRGACDLYNAALESGLRIVCRDSGLKPGYSYEVETAGGKWDIVCTISSSQWDVRDFGRFEFVSDYEIKGLRNHYVNYGLGVPMIAVRENYQGEPQVAKYYPPDLSFPVTAFLRPGNVHTINTSTNRLPGASQRAALELYDPIVRNDLELEGRRVPLQSDLTTPLAYFLSKPELGALATVGLLRPDVMFLERPTGGEPIMGLYMVQPYQPGKIPVIMVHGLWSSPMTWMQMFNDLRADPTIRQNYQFWFYLYPTAEPFWVTAAKFRKDLQEMRESVDPQHREPALDRIVLVGHSMGGLVSRLQTIDSGNDFWQLVSNRPIDELKLDPDTRKELEETFFFHANPSIRRVITIGTPHHGSEFSNETTQWLASWLIRLPKKLIQTQQRLFRENKDLLKPESLLAITDSIESLAPECPVFGVILAGHKAPWVVYHNIIGVLPQDKWIGRIAGEGDGVVQYASAHVEDAASELVVPADHVAVHAHPLAILEVRRILLEHLQQTRVPDGAPGVVQPAGYPSLGRSIDRTSPRSIEDGDVNAVVSWTTPFEERDGFASAPYADEDGVARRQGSRQIAVVASPVEGRDR